jgi:hypothetical protein
VDSVLEDVATRLPAHMLPERIVVVDRIPLSANGKVDRAAVTDVGDIGTASLLADVRHEVQKALMANCRRTGFFGQSCPDERAQRPRSNIASRTTPR